MCYVCAIFRWWGSEWCPISWVKISTTTPCGSVLRGLYSVKGTLKLELGPREGIGIVPLSEQCHLRLFLELLLLLQLQQGSKARRAVSLQTYGTSSLYFLFVNLSSLILMSTPDNNYRANCGWLYVSSPRQRCLERRDRLSPSLAFFLCPIFSLLLPPLCLKM